MKQLTGFFCFLALFCPSLSFAASSDIVSKVYDDNPHELNGKLHIVYADGRDVLAPKLNAEQLAPIAVGKEKNLYQTDFIFPRISPDGKTVAWEANVMHPLFSSEPWSSAVVVYRDGKIISIIKSPELTISGWGFFNHGKQIAISSSTLHFVTGIEYDLYETDTGKKLKDFGWLAEENQPLPDWALAAKETE